MKNLHLLFAVLGIFYFVVIFITMFKEPFNDQAFIISWILAMFNTSIFLYLSKKKNNEKI